MIDLVIDEFLYFTLVSDTTNDVCPYQDICFVLDAGSNVGPPEWGAVQQFVGEIVNTLPIGVTQNAVCVLYS